MLSIKKVLFVDFNSLYFCKSYKHPPFELQFSLVTLLKLWATPVKLMKLYQLKKGQQEVKLGL